MSDDLVTVRILGLPVPIAMASQEHFDELSREFLHLANADEAVRNEVPGRLLALSDELRARFSSFTETNEQLLDDAAARGDERIDLTYEVPAEAAPFAAQLGELLDEADRYCAAGEYLLTLTTPPAQLAYRRWYLAQFVDQAAGGPAVAFDEWVAERKGAAG
jgi:hypothetical protein